MTAQLPHDPYITAVLDALTTAGLAPEDFWTSDAEINQYEDGDTTQLDALLIWSADHPAIDPSVYPDGLLLVWEHPAGHWQWAEKQTTGNNPPQVLLALPMWAGPVGVVEVVRELLAGKPAPTEPRPLWGGHTDAQTAVDAWAV